MNKKGQFFLIAALVIIAIILGLASIQIASRTSKENVVIFNLANEIDLEGKSVVDHGIFEGGTEASATSGRIEQLMQYYTDAYPDSEIQIVYGDTESYNIVKQEEVNTGGPGIGTGSNPTIPVIMTEITSTSGSCPKPDVPCTVQLRGEDDAVLSEAQINPTQTFYAVIAGTNAEGETTKIDTSGLSKPTV